MTVGSAEPAHAFKLFGINLFGSDDEEAADVIDPVRYSTTLNLTTATGDLKDRLETTSALKSDEKQPVSGDLGLVIKAREDRDRLVAVLYEEARYGAVVRITIAGQEIDRLPPVPVFDHSQPVPVVVTVEPGPEFALGKVTLEGDAAGIDPKSVGLEPGKKADVILVDLRRPHLYPAHMPEFRVTYFANGNDVHTVLVGGKVLLRDRQPVHVNQDAVLDAAQREAELMIDRLGLRYALETPRMFWRHSRDLDVIE